VVGRIEALATGTERITVLREGTRRPISADVTKLFAAASDRHVEVMRDDLSEIYYEATLPDVAYMFGDSITSIGDEVRFESGAPRRCLICINAVASPKRQRMTAKTADVKPDRMEMIHGQCTC